MMFDVATKTTDIIMFNSRNLGALIVDEKPHVKSWDEPQYSIHNLGIEESYGFGVLNEGQGNRRSEERQGPPERDVDARGVDHLSRNRLSGLRASFWTPRWRSLRLSTTTTTTSRLSGSSASNSVNRRPRNDAELRSAAEDSRPRRRIASVYGDFRRPQLGPGPVRAQFSDWEVTGSVLDSRQQTQMAADYQISTAVERYP
jgi:hypothetical protein